MKNDKEKSLLIKHLIKHFGGGFSVGPCSCIGVPQCCDLGCSAVWEYILDDPERLQMMVRLYGVISGDIDIGRYAGKILKVIDVRDV